MKYKFVPIVFSVSALLLACGGNQTEEKDAVADTTVVTDTTVVRDTVVQTMVQPVDTAAIIAAYEAQYAKTKSKNTKPVYKTVATKQVTAYPEPEIQSVAPAKITVDVAGYNYIADKNAVYPGGRKAFLEYFFKNFQYPEEAIENNIQGTIYSEVFISEEGIVEKVEFPGHKLGYGLEEEAGRAIMGVKHVIPATKNGVNVKSRYVLPIKVIIKN
jgi:periplasmic protein TonB